MACNYKVEGLESSESTTDNTPVDTFGRAAPPVDEAMHTGTAESYTTEA